MQSFLTILQILTGIIVVILVLLQDGKEGASLVASEASRSGSSMGTSREAKLAKATAYVGAFFAFITIVAGTYMAVHA